MSQSERFVKTVYAGAAKASGETIPANANELWELEGRVYQLEKELAFMSNIILLASLVAMYYGFRWYQENVGKIPGVET